MQWKTFILFLFFILFGGWVVISVDGLVNVNPLHYVNKIYNPFLNIAIGLIFVIVIMIVIYKVIK